MYRLRGLAPGRYRIAVTPGPNRSAIPVRLEAGDQRDGFDVIAPGRENHNRYSGCPHRGDDPRAGKRSHLLKRIRSRLFNKMQIIRSLTPVTACYTGIGREPTRLGSFRNMYRYPSRLSKHASVPKGVRSVIFPSPTPVPPPGSSFRHLSLADPGEFVPSFPLTAPNRRPPGEFVPSCPLAAPIRRLREFVPSFFPSPTRPCRPNFRRAYVRFRTSIFSEVEFQTEALL